MRKTSTASRLAVHTYLHVPPTEDCLYLDPRVPPDGQDEKYVDDDQPYGVHRSLFRVLPSHVDLDHECQKVGEENNHATLFARHRPVDRRVCSDEECRGQCKCFGVSMLVWVRKSSGGRERKHVGIFGGGGRKHSHAVGSVCGNRW